MQTETMDEIKFFIFNTFRGTSFPAFLTRDSIFYFALGPTIYVTGPCRKFTCYRFKFLFLVIITEPQGSLKTPLHLPLMRKRCLDHG